MLMASPFHRLHRLHRLSTGPSRQRTGFTLIEVLVVVALIAALLLLALPALDEWIGRQRLQQAAQSVLSDLHLARSEALRGARNVVLRIGQSAAGSCYLLHTGPVNGCDCPPAGPPHCRPEATALKLVQWPLRTGHPRLDANVTSMLFSGKQGTTSLAATLQVQVEGIGTIRHVVAITGRVRSCSQEGSFGRWARCE